MEYAQVFPTFKGQPGSGLTSGAVVGVMVGMEVNLAVGVFSGADNVAVIIGDGRNTFVFSLSLA